MKQKQVIMVIALVVAVIAIIAIVVAMTSPDTTKEEFVETLEDGTKINTSEKLSETKTYKGLEFTDIEFTNSASVTTLATNVTNTTGEDMSSQVVGINVLDEEGNVITNFKGTVESLQAGETTTFSASIAANYTNAYDIEIVAPQ